jgi:hypothetical protein
MEGCASLWRGRMKAQVAAVAKLIQRIDNSPAAGLRALQASHCITYQTVQFGKVVFVDPRQPCLAPG